MVDLNGNEAGNGGHMPRKAYRVTGSPLLGVKTPGARDGRSPQRADSGFGAVSFVAGTGPHSNWPWPGSPAECHRLAKGKVVCLIGEGAFLNLGRLGVESKRKRLREG